MRQPARAAADVFLDRWCARAEATGIRRLKQFAKTLQTHRQGLLDWYIDPISTGPLEGTNTKIRVLQAPSLRRPRPNLLSTQT